MLLALLVLLPVFGCVFSKGTICTSPTGTSIQIKDIPEDTPIGTSLAHVEIYGSETEVQIDQDGVNEFVQFDKTSRNLTLVKELDAETMAKVTLNLLCTILPGPQKVKIPVLIFIEDVNDNPPEFEKDNYKVNVSELFPVGSSVISNIQAKDKDKNSWHIKYKLQDGPHSDLFSIPVEREGNIILSKSLDFETAPYIELTVLAEDAHNKDNRLVFTSSTTVSVTVRDDDDMNPSFVASYFSAQLVENVTAGTVLQTSPLIAAADQDAALKAELIYSIAADADSKQSEYFDIDPTKGEVSVKNAALIRGTQFSLLLQATQKNNPSRVGTSILRVNVQAANHNAPRFTQTTYEASVVENTPPDTTVIGMAAVDNDEGAVLTYRIKAGENMDHFSILSERGLVVTAKQLDHESAAEYVFTVEVSDGHYTSDATLVIKVVDVNDNSPVFSQPVYVFDSAQEENALVGRVMATDLDRNQTLIYRFASDVTNWPVDIEPRTGELRLREGVKDLTSPEVRLFILARDSGSPPRDGACLAILRFPQFKDQAVVGKRGEDNQMDLVVIIVLAVLSGCLLLIIIVMLIYIYKKQDPMTKRSDKNKDFVISSSSRKPEEYLDAYEAATASGSFYREAGLSRQSFEKQLHNLAQDSELKHSERHLAIYQGLDLDSTRPQDSPFMADNAHEVQMTSSSSSSSRSSRPPESLTLASTDKRMYDASEIDYETSVAPLQAPPPPPEVAPPQPPATKDAGLSSSSDSDGSVTSLACSLSTFKGGSASSTKHLLTGGKPKRASVTFSDGPQYTVYNPSELSGSQSSSNETVQSKPGITVYY